MACKDTRATELIAKTDDVASDVGVNLCNVKSSLNTSNNGGFTEKGGDPPCFNISKHPCPVVKSSDENFVLFYIDVKSMG